ncbi:MAG: hypothetical protein ACFE8A_08980 [Candidatus Hodarchaeota archaeon]
MVCDICGTEKDIPSCCDQSMIIKDELLCCCEKCGYITKPKCCGKEMSYI